ncbi:MAG: DUF1778 domain-containing protein [Cyanosarcina radialis HA8281-LM2]|jgi:RNA polymerase subunit RPABC4/transcription elongation factor Spt4|nr:DUF1778 domain-containing protein [Cyanosarcina radialis HA8281-LM2]
MSKYFTCRNCGADVPIEACGCPECGSDRETGWSEAERVIALSEKDAQIVFSLLENPPEPNAQLKAAFEKHKAFSGDK